MRKYFLQVCFSFLALLYLFIKIDWEVLFDIFRQLDIVFYCLASGSMLINIYVNASKFHWLLKDTSLSLPVSRLMKISLIARYYSIFIPTPAGPAAVQWYKVTKNKQGKSFFLAVTIVERLFFVLVLVLCGTVPLFFYTQSEAQVVLLREQLSGLMVVTYLILFVLLIYFFVPSIHRACVRMINRVTSIKEGGKTDQFLRNFSLKNTSLKTIGVLFLFSLLWQFLFLFRIYLIFKTTHLPFTFLEAIWIGSLVLMLQGLPVSFAGLGVREGAYAYLFTLYGLPAEQGVINGLLFFSQVLILAGIGAVLNLFEK